MKTLTTIALLALTLAACAPGMPASTDTPVPTATSTALPPTLTPTLEVTPTIALPTPLPTNPPTIMITPDPIQVDEWETYQTELIKVVLPHAFSPEFALCEWIILGRSDQELYLYVICSGDDMPVVVYLNADGSLQDVKAPVRGSAWNSMIQELFPADIQEKITPYYSNFHPVTQELYDHITYRQTHRDVPPLIILSAMPTATRTP
jgi:hypothetical protein